ncbi:MAG: threonine ammonia-lyase [Trebonia sp.]
MPDLVSLGDIRAAAHRLNNVIVRTPLVPVPRLASPEVLNLLVKPESLQPTGAFKLRGAYNAIAALPADRRASGVVAHSSGNHGFAVAYAARKLGVKAAIVVPRGAPAVKTAAIESVGAELVLVEPTLEARVSASAHIAQTRGYAEVPPFDHRDVIAGQGTIGLEIADDLAAKGTAPAAVLVPVSGGGLISGIAAAVKALSPDTKVIGVEPELAADARESLHTGARVAWDAKDVARTMADALRVEQVGVLPFAHMRELVSDIVTVTEDEIVDTIKRLALQARLVAEPGGAVAVAAALFRTASELGVAKDGERPIVAVLSGGNIDPALLGTILTT